MTMLPEHIINKIMLYVSHPIADMYRRQTRETFGDIKTKVVTVKAVVIVMKGSWSG